MAGFLLGSLSDEVLLQFGSACHIRHEFFVCVQVEVADELCEIVGGRAKRGYHVPCGPPIVLASTNEKSNKRTRT